MAIEDFNQIKDVVNALDTQRPARFGYKQAAISATGPEEISALTGVYLPDDSSPVNSIPTPDLIAIDPLINDIGLRTQSASLTRMLVNHFFGRISLNLIKLTEKVKLLVSDHLVNRYITPSGNVMEDVTVRYDADEIFLVKHKSPLSAAAPVTASAAISIPFAVSGVSAGVMTATDKQILDNLNNGDDAAVRITGEQTVAGIKTFSSIPEGPSSDPTTDNQLARKKYVDDLDAHNVKLTGDQTIADVKTFSSIPVGPASNPTTDNQLARKAYVDTKLNSTMIETVLTPTADDKIPTSKAVADVMRKFPGPFFRVPSFVNFSNSFSPPVGAYSLRWYGAPHNIFISVANTGSPVGYSNDGITWHLASTPVGAANRAMRKSSYSPKLEKFLVTSQAGASGVRAITSNDGKTWDLLNTFPDQGTYDHVWVDEWEKWFVFSGSFTLTRYYDSIDGVNWNPRDFHGTITFGALTAVWAKYLNKLVCAPVSVLSTNACNKNCMFSSDGVTWEVAGALPPVVTTMTGGNIFSMAVSESLGIIVGGVSWAGTYAAGKYNFIYSYDAVTWYTGVILNDAFAVRNIKWIEEYKIFIAVADNVGAAVYKYAYSDNGVDWFKHPFPQNFPDTTITSSMLQNLFDLGYSPKLDMFVAGAGDKLLYFS